MNITHITWRELWRKISGREIGKAEGAVVIYSSHSSKCLPCAGGDGNLISSYLSKRGDWKISGKDFDWPVWVMHPFLDQSPQPWGGDTTWLTGLDKIPNSHGQHTVPPQMGRRQSWTHISRLRCSGLGWRVGRSYSQRLCFWFRWGFTEEGALESGLWEMSSSLPGGEPEGQRT